MSYSMVLRRNVELPELLNYGRDVKFPYKKKVAIQLCNSDNSETKCSETELNKLQSLLKTDYKTAGTTVSIVVADWEKFYLLDDFIRNYELDNEEDKPLLQVDQLRGILEFCKDELAKSDEELVEDAEPYVSFVPDVKYIREDLEYTIKVIEAELALAKSAPKGAYVEWEYHTF